MEDKSQKERAALLQKIVRIEQLEDDVRALKNRHEQALLDRQANFQHLSHQVESLIIASAEAGDVAYRDLQDNQELTLQMERFTAHYLEGVTQQTNHLRRRLDNEREDLITERNQLPWE